MTATDDTRWKRRKVDNKRQYAGVRYHCHYADRTEGVWSSAVCADNSGADGRTTDAIASSRMVASYKGTVASSANLDDGSPSSLLLGHIPWRFVVDTGMARRFLAVTVFSPPVAVCRGRCCMSYHGAGPSRCAWASRWCGQPRGGFMLLHISPRYFRAPRRLPVVQLAVLGSVELVHHVPAPSKTHGVMTSTRTCCSMGFFLKRHIFRSSFPIHEDSQSFPAGMCHTRAKSSP